MFIRKSKYKALEQGMDELEENYQQQLLDAYDEIKAWEAKCKLYQARYDEKMIELKDRYDELVDLTEKLRLHDENCLPELGKNYTPLDEDESSTERQDHVEQPDQPDPRRD